MAKLKIEFDGFDETINRLKDLGGNVKVVSEKALKDSHAYVTPKLHAEMQKHKQTGETESSIVDTAKVEWAGSVGSVKVGFDISNGGLPSIFLMYGTPRMPKDQKLYNAIYGKATQDEIKGIQQDVFLDEIMRYF